LKQLQGLVEAGNTIVVVEHNMTVAAASDWIIDTGPGAGAEGGLIVAAERQHRYRANGEALRRHISRLVCPRLLNSSKCLIASISLDQNTGVHLFAPRADPKTRYVEA
jgi:hypothetical protein